MLTRENVTKEDVDKMSDVEVKFWCQSFAEAEAAEQMKEHILGQIRKRDNIVLTPEPRILPIHVDSTVID